MKCVEWDEPFPGLNADGQEVTVNQRISMTAEDAIKAMRKVYQKHGKGCRMSDEHLLNEFITVHWAEVKET